MKYLFVMGLVLSACASNNGHIPPPIIQTQKVEVPVKVKCTITWPDKPKKHLVRSGSVLIKGNAILAENLEYEAYTKALEIAVKECLKEQN